MASHCLMGLGWRERGKCECWQVLRPSKWTSGKHDLTHLSHVLCVWWIMWSVIAWSLYLRPDLGWNLSVIIILSHAYFWHVTKYICKSTCWKVPSKCPYVNPLVMVIHVVISVHVCWRVLASVLRINTAITVSLCRFANYTCAVILTKCGEISQVKWSFVYCQ